MKTSHYVARDSRGREFRHFMFAPPYKFAVIANYRKSPGLSNGGTFCAWCETQEEAQALVRARKNTPFIESVEVLDVTTTQE